MVCSALKIWKLFHFNCFWLRWGVRECEQIHMQARTFDTFFVLENWLLWSFNLFSLHQLTRPHHKFTETNFQVDVCMKYREKWHRYFTETIEVGSFYWLVKNRPSHAQQTKPSSKHRKMRKKKSKQATSAWKELNKGKFSALNVLS